MTDTTDTTLLVIGCVLLVAGTRGVATTDQQLLAWSGVILGLALVVLTTGPQVYHRLSE